MYDFADLYDKNVHVQKNVQNVHKLLIKIIFSFRSNLRD